MKLKLVLLYAAKFTISHLLNQERVKLNAGSDEIETTEKFGDRVERRILDALK
jgi:uncharacterized protein Yka (UPF0111/DUF47 family)